MKKLLIILTVFILNIAFAMADIYITVDGDPIVMTSIETNDDTFLSKKILTDDNLGGLQDGEIIFKGAHYDIREAITIELEEDPDRGYKLNVGYYYIFDETIDLSDVSLSNLLLIEFARATRAIGKISSDISLAELEGQEYDLDVGQSIVFEGKTITLENVGESGSVIVNVNGVRETVSSTLEIVNGIEIKVKETSYHWTKYSRSAILLIGEDIFLDYVSGDSFKDSSKWYWDLDNLNEKSATTLTLDGISGPYIGIKNNPSWNDFNSGECFKLPNLPSICTITSCEECSNMCEESSDCTRSCNPIIDNYVMQSCFCEDNKCHDITACEIDSDCVQVQNDLCGCKFLSINKDYNEKWGSRLEYKTHTKACSSPCKLIEYTSICENNMCKLSTDVKKEETESGNIYDFLEGVVKEGGYILVLGDEAQSSDSLAAADIIAGIISYSGGETILEANLASEVIDKDNRILLGNPCENPLIDLSCVNWPYNQGETLIKIDGNSLIIAGTTAEDTRSTAKIVAKYKDYPFLKKSDTILITESGLEIPEIIAGLKQEIDTIKEGEAKEEVIEEPSGEESEEETEEEEEISEEEPTVEEPVEEKKKEYKSFTKRIFEWILSWFR